jgi:hypothetical protein
MPDEPNHTAPPAPSPASPVGGESGSVLPRAALERVLARATELQASGADTPETISEARLLEIGHEVGIDPNHLRMAIAEERGRSPMVPDTPGRIEQALGAAHTGTQRAVPGTPDTVLASLDRWLQREEQLVVKRRFGQRMSWERTRNPFASISRSLSGKPADLQKVDEVSAVITPVDGTRSLVRLDADLRLHRKSLKDGTVVLAVVNGVLAAAWIVPVTVLGAVSPTASAAAPLVVLAVAVGGLQAVVSTLIWGGLKKSFREAMVRTHLRLEQLLDALEHGDVGSPPSLLEQLKQSFSSTRL